MNEKTNYQLRLEIAQEICNSEAFARLMVGSNTVNDDLDMLRPAWKRYLEVNGGYGKGRDRRAEE